MIIAAACEDDEKIQITPDRKKVYFWNSDFVSMCGEMLKKYAGGTFKRGTFFSIAGVSFEEYEVPAFVFDFKEAVEHMVKSPGNSKRYAGKKPHPTFNMLFSKCSSHIPGVCHRQAPGGKTEMENPGEDVVGTFHYRRICRRPYRNVLFQA